jgi:hypothetical protein
MAQESITYRVTFYALAALGCGGCSHIGGGGRLSRSCDDLLAKATVLLCWTHDTQICASHSSSLRHSPGTGCYELVASSQSSSSHPGVDVKVRHDRGSMIDASRCARHHPSF